MSPTETGFGTKPRGRAHLAALLLSALLVALAAAGSGRAIAVSGSGRAIASTGSGRATLNGAGGSIAAQAGAGRLLLTGATIVDGLDADPYRADVLIVDGRIAALEPAGRIPASSADVVEDLDGLVLAPGFIDIHNHSDRAVIREPLAEALVSQGLTTIVVGADGGSPWPLDDYLRDLDEARPALDVAVLAGHGTIRRQVMGDDANRAARDDEIAAMLPLVEAAMEAGAFGLSTGLEYQPGAHATTEELIALSKVAARHDGFYMSHLRDEEEFVMEAIDEAIRIGFEADLPVQISHIKMGDATAWGRSAEALARLRAARDRGLDATADWYPYAASSTSLALVVPSRRFDDPEAVAAGLAIRGGADRIQISRYEADPAIEGLRLDAVAERYGRTPVDTYMMLMRNGGAGMISHSMQLADVNAFAADELVMVCSDGGIGSAHPRGAGTFPRVLAHYVRDEGILSLARAVHKMTAMPADRLGLPGRGRIAVGARADLVAFDAATVRDNSTFEEPGLLATGIERVWVGGELVWRDGTSTGARPGRALRRR